MPATAAIAQRPLVSSASWYHLSESGLAPKRSCVVGRVIVMLTCACVFTSSNIVLHKSTYRIKAVIPVVVGGEMREHQRQENEIKARSCCLHMYLQPSRAYPAMDPSRYLGGLAPGYQVGRSAANTVTVRVRGDAWRPTAGRATSGLATRADCIL